jgi:hypothetical protein
MNRLKDPIKKFSYVYNRWCSSLETSVHVTHDGHHFIHHPWLTKWHFLSPATSKERPIMECAVCVHTPKAITRDMRADISIWSTKWYFGYISAWTNITLVGTPPHTIPLFRQSTGHTHSFSSMLLHIRQCTYIALSVNPHIYTAPGIQSVCSFSTLANQRSQQPLQA